MVEKSRKFLCFVVKEDVPMCDFISSMQKDAYAAKYGASEWHAECKRSISGAEARELRFYHPEMHEVQAFQLPHKRFVDHTPVDFLLESSKTHTHYFQKT